MPALSYEMVPKAHVELGPIHEMKEREGKNEDVHDDVARSMFMNERIYSLNYVTRISGYRRCHLRKISVE